MGTIHCGIDFNLCTAENMPEQTHDLEKVKEEFFAQGYSLVEDAVQPEMVDRLEAAVPRVWAKILSYGARAEPEEGV